MPSLAEWIGIYGAVLSSGLAVYEFVKYRRAVVLTLVYSTADRHCRLTVTNGGQRPVTIMSIKGWVLRGKGRTSNWQDVSHQLIGATLRTSSLPVTLSDSEPAIFDLRSEISGVLLANRRGLRLQVIDSERRVFTRVKLIYDPPPSITLG